MGASGIVSPIVTKPFTTWNSQSWKIVFAASFIGAANLYLHFVDPNALHSGTKMERPLSMAGYQIAGLLVGFGTKLGNGCTSGHGICGLARFSRRSFAAVATFMGVGMATAATLSHYFDSTRVNFLYAGASQQQPPNTTPDPSMALLFAAVPALLALWSVMRKKKSSRKKTLGAAISGALFAVGLAVSKMVIPAKVFGFLDVTRIPSGNYDPSLAAVMGGGLVISYLGYQLRSTKPIVADEFNIPCNTVIDFPLLFGAACFGMGWGVGGLCPGPALFQAAVGTPAVAFFWIPAFFAGSYLGSEVQDRLGSACKV